MDAHGRLTVKGFRGRLQIDNHQFTTLPSLLAHLPLARVGTQPPFSSITHSEGEVEQVARRVDPQTASQHDHLVDAA